MYLRSSLLLLFWLFTNCATSQSVNYTIYDTETGLPSSEVYSGFQSKDGLLWFTSDRGVFTYNGYNFKSYTTSDGLGNNTCFGIYEGKDGSIWFSGYDGSLTFYNGLKFSVHREISGYIKKNYRNDWIDFCDFSEGKIFFSLTKNKRLFEYSVATKKIKECSWVYEMPAGSKVTLGRTSYYLSFVEARGPVSKRRYYTLSKIFKINNSVSVASKGEKVYKLLEDKKKLRIIDSWNFNSFVQSKNILIQDTLSGDFFVSTEQGLFLCNFNNKIKIIQQVLKDVNTNNVTKDHEGNYWVSTFNKGVIFIPSVGITTYAETPIGQERIHSVLYQNGELIAGSASGIIYFLKDASAKGYTIDLHHKVPVEQFLGISNNMLLGYNIIKKINDRWVITDSAGPIMQRITGYTRNTALFTRQNNVFLLNESNKPSVTPNSRLNLIKSICYAHGKVWIGTITNLVSAELQGDTLANYIDHSKKHSVLAQRVNDIKSFRNGILLSSFGNGLVFYDGEVPRPIKHSKILNKDLINRILVVDAKTVLLLTNNGLIKLSFKNSSTFIIESAELFDVNDGLSSNFINDAYLEQQVLWLATNKGVNSIPLANLRASTTPPPVNIIGLRTQDSSFRYAPEIELSYSQNSFIVEFEGISFKKSNNFPFYKYCLLNKGSDTVWNYTNERFIQFTNLAPGEYIFLVSARSKNSDWATYKSLQIYIHPHFTQTWWFRILALVLIALGIYTFFRVRINNIKLKNEQQKKVEMLGSKALETELMALRNQMNPHFVFNSLNSIQRYIITNNFADANSYITRFSKLMRTSLSMSKLEFVGLDKEIEFISTYMDLEKMRFDNLFEYHIDLDEDLDAEMTQIPTLLIQPLLENSIKHGFKNRSEGGNILISIKHYDSKHLLIEVIDNGKGIQHLEDILAEKQSETSFGLGIVMQRMRLLKERTNDNEITFKLVNIETGVKATLIVPLN